MPYLKENVLDVSRPLTIGGKILAPHASALHLDEIAVQLKKMLKFLIKSIIRRKVKKGSVLMGTECLNTIF